MKKNGLFEKMLDYTPKRDIFDELEIHANHAIASIFNILDFIEANFDEEEAADLERKLLLSIRHRDYTKFRKTLMKLKNNKD